MSARYIFRLDDITPTMDWGKFESLMNLFIKHSIKPLLGIVPDNRDPSLVRNSANPSFWDTMRAMRSADSIDIAQHGYQHILAPRPGASLLHPKRRGKDGSEFAGDPYHDQVFRIREGNRILREHGLPTSYWMAPNHSLDHTTLRALADLGFTAVTDGIALLPFTYRGLIFVPQQTWRPYWMPCGVQTICIHTNEITPAEIKRLRVFLRRPFHFSRFAQVVSEHSDTTLNKAANYSFKALYLGATHLKSLSAKHLRGVFRQPAQAIATSRS